MDEMKRVTIITAVVLLAWLLFPLLNTNVALAVGPTIQCCTTEQDGGQCVGCPEGAICTSTVDFCESEGGFLGLGNSCFNNPDGAQCGTAIESAGCCVLENGTCEDLGASDGCFLREGSPGEIFVGGLSCSLVPQCTPTRNIPTMSNWGLLTLAAIIILVGVWGITRKKAQA